MTIQELIQSGDKKEMARISRLMDKLKSRDLDRKLFVIKVYLICKVIVVIGIAYTIIELF